MRPSRLSGSRRAGCTRSVWILGQAYFCFALLDGHTISSGSHIDPESLVVLGWVILLSNEAEPGVEGQSVECDQNQNIPMKDGL